MLKVFISHSHKDYKKIDKYIEPLKSMKDLRIFYSKESLNCGDNIDKELQNAINESDLIILLHSKNTVESSYVNQEVGYALGKKKKILPFLLDTSKPKGFLEKMKYIRIKSNDPEVLYKEIAKRISKKMMDDNRNIFYLVILIVILLVFVKE